MYTGHNERALSVHAAVVLPSVGGEGGGRTPYLVGAACDHDVNVVQAILLRKFPVYAK